MVCTEYSVYGNEIPIHSPNEYSVNVLLVTFVTKKGQTLIYRDETNHNKSALYDEYIEHIFYLVGSSDSITDHAILFKLSVYFYYADSLLYIYVASS